MGEGGRVGRARRRRIEATQPPFATTFIRRNPAMRPAIKTITTITTRRRILIGTAAALRRDGPRPGFAAIKYICPGLRAAAPTR
ncbi:MAG: hypothetical protein U1F67_25175 [Rubrivivax sp.]